jgi:hypothetical protein
MEQHHEKKSTPASFNENFDCNKMKSLLLDNSSTSFGEKFKQWLDAYTKAAREKIWTDIEYYKSW